MELIYLNDFKENFSEYISVKNIIFDDLHSLLYSHDMFLLDCYLDTNLKNKFGNISTSQKSTFNGIEFQYNNNFIVFNMNLLSSQFNDFVKYLVSVSNNKVLFDKKLLFIIKNIHVLSRTQQNIISTLIQSLKSYIVICTTINHSKSTERLKSVLFCYKIFITDIKKIIKLYAKDQGIIDIQLIKDVTKENKNLYSSILHLHTGIYEDVITNEIYILVSSIKKTRDIASYISKIREVFYKLIIYNIHRKQLLHSILYAIQRKFKNKNVDLTSFVLEQLCILDNNIIFSAKPIYHYELFFIKLYKYINI